MRRADARDVRALIGAAALTLVAGIVVIALAGDTVATVIGIGLLGLAALALVSLVFLLVGQSEERDRRRDPGG
jgi:hypothetical protein